MNTNREKQGKTGTTNLSGDSSTFSTYDRIAFFVATDRQDRALLGRYLGVESHDTALLVQVTNVERVLHERVQNTTHAE